MNDRDHAVYQALERVSSFQASHAAAFPATSRANADFDRIAPLLGEIGHVDFRPGLPASAATGAKAHLFAELWDDLKAIANTARTIARDEPGFDVNFRLADDSQRSILATATSFQGNLQNPATVAKFTAYDLPSGFVTDLQADLVAITGKGADQNVDRLDATGETTRIRNLIVEGRDILNRLDTSVRNRFRNDPQILAEWRAAARIHRAARPGEDTPPLPPAPLAPAQG